MNFQILLWEWEDILREMDVIVGLVMDASTKLNGVIVKQVQPWKHNQVQLFINIVSQMCIQPKH